MAHPLRLVPLAREHFEFLIAMYADPEVMRWIATGQPRSREVSLSILEKRLVAPSPEAYWVIFEGERPVGAAMLMIRAPGKPLELGFMLARDVWGKGYATQAARLAIDHALTLVDRVEAYTAKENNASQAVLRKVGFRDIGEVPGPYGGLDLGFSLTRP